MLYWTPPGPTSRSALEREFRVQRARFGSAQGLELNNVDRFRYRTRYFTDSGIIGTKEFVSRIYQEFKGYFASRHEKCPKPVQGLNGVYSLKRLSESIA